MCKIKNETYGNDQKVVLSKITPKYLYYDIEYGVNAENNKASTSFKFTMTEKDTLCVYAVSDLPEYKFNTMRMFLMDYKKVGVHNKEKAELFFDSPDGVSSVSLEKENGRCKVSEFLIPKK